jgi:hypothetical protein
LKLDLLVGMDDDYDPGQTWFNSGNGDSTFNPDWTLAVDSGPAESGTNRPGAGTCDAYDFDNDGTQDVIAFANGVGGILFPGALATFPDSAVFGDSTVVYTSTTLGVRRTGAAPSFFPTGFTPAGQAVATNLGPFAVTAFDSVSSPGVTSLAFGDPSAGPAGSDTSLAVLNITTTASFQDSVSLTIPYAQFGVLLAGVDENTLQLYQSSSGLRSWSAVPAILNTTADLLHARVATLSSFALTGTVATGVPDVPPVPAGSLALHPPRPNPSAHSTSISFQLPKDEDVLLRLYDVRGRVVRTLLNERRPVGFQTLAWDGRDDDRKPVPSGVYFYRLSAGGRHETRKVVLIK